MSKYELGKVIGRGGMGQVHASHDRFGRAVVVKRLRQTLLDNFALQQRLIDEGKLLDRVVHHNVVRALDSGSGDDGMPYLVMDHAAGISLGKLLDRDGSLSLQRAFAIAAQLLAGLSAVHEARIIHADIKSSNILVDDAERVTIIDFGLARTVTRHDGKSDEIVGTPAYMAPEVITGAAPTVATDIYAVGAVLYEMLTGATPFATAPDIFGAHVHDPVVPPSLRAPECDIPAAVDRVVLRALAKSPAARYASAREFGAALEAAVATVWKLTTLDVMLDDRVTRDLERTTLRREVADPPTTRVAVKPDLKITGALDRVRVLVENKAHAEAIEILEAVRAESAAANQPDPELWRLEIVLAALYDMSGRRERARRIAIVARKHAASSGSLIAVTRTSALVDRLAPRPSIAPMPRLPSRLPRGSAQFKRGR
jgi:serine/threonine protein kinase